MFSLDELHKQEEENHLYKLRPRGNMVLLERLVAQDQTKGGVFLPDRARENPLLAKVIDIGPGKETLAGSERSCHHVLGLEVGDIVFFNIKQAIPCERDPNSRLCLVDADHILAVLENPQIPRE